MSDDEVRDIVLKNAIAVNATAGRKVNSVFVIRERLVNIVVK